MRNTDIGGRLECLSDMLNLTVGYLCAKWVLAMLFTFAESIFYENRSHGAQLAKLVA